MWLFFQTVSYLLYYRQPLYHFVAEKTSKLCIVGFWDDTDLPPVCTPFTVPHCSSSCKEHFRGWLAHPFLGCPQPATESTHEYKHLAIWAQLKTTWKSRSSSRAPVGSAQVTGLRCNLTSPSDQSCFLLILPSTHVANRGHALHYHLAGCVSECPS